MSVASVGYVDLIPIYQTAADRDTNTGWNPGDLVYSKDSGYAYYDGASWHTLNALASFLRAFGPDTATAVPANAWTAIVLDPAGEPWRQFGTPCWEWIPPGDPDYTVSPAGIRCLKEGVYDLTGSVVFDTGTGTGTRGVRVVEVQGPYAGQWQLTTSVPMPKATLIPILVSGESYQYQGNIIELQAWTDTATQTMANPQSEWLSATYIGTP
jgi:hypothetical protein